MTLKRITLGALLILMTNACGQKTEQQTRFAELSNLFENANVVGSPSIVDCKLSGGTQTQCFSVTTGPAPSNHKTGPYCPRKISDTADQAGTWFVNEELYDVDGKFIEQLAVIYQDEKWNMYDPETGNVTLVDGELGCEVAGDPNSASDYTNYCVECEVKYLGSEANQTYVFPLEPVMGSEDSGRIGPHTGIGLAFNGVKLDAPAPLRMILGSHTLGLFDACSGHVNPVTGYHYHGLVGCEPEKAAAVAEHGSRVAIAMDGFDMYSRLEESNDDVELDQCGGHEISGLKYHYHVEAAGTNQFIGCFKGESGCTQSDASALCDATANRGGRRGGPRRD